jgi:hypothetical protein
VKAQGNKQNVEKKGGRKEGRNKQRMREDEKEEQ